jgi:GNAT superfamily N-acetyltransferase
MHRTGERTPAPAVRPPRESRPAGQRPSLAVRAYRVLRDEGWRTFGLKLASTLGYRRMLVLAASTQTPLSAPPAIPGLTCALLEPADVDAYLAFRPEASRDELLERWREGGQCCVARVGDRVVAAAWSRRAQGGVAWIDYELALAPDEIYLHDAYTDEAWRGRGIAHVLCVWQLAHLRDQGFRRALRATVVENAAALRAHGKSGFRPIALITHVRLGPWRRTVRRSAGGPS